MLTHKEIVEKILAFRSDLTEETLHQMIQKKREATGYLLTEGGATYMVANELGINLSNGKMIRTISKIKDLPLGVNDATIVGRVIAISSIQSFKRKDGVEGKVARLVVSDETGTINVVLWNGKTSILKPDEVALNQVIRVSHGYVREGLNSEPEFNVGRRGTIVVLSSEPSLDTKQLLTHYKNIVDLKEGDSFINVRGVVKGISRISSFIRRNNGRGRVVRLRLVDETGCIKAVFWDDQVDSVKTLQVGDVIELRGGRVQRGLGDEVEVHFGRFSKIKRLRDSEVLKHLPLVLTKINSLNAGMNDVAVLGRVIGVGQIREFEKRSGKVGKVGNLYLMDETGSVRLALWDEKAESIADITRSDVVLVEGGYTRQGRGNAIDLNLGELGSLTVNPEIEEVSSLPTISSNIVSLGEIKVGMQNITVEGKVTEPPTVRDVTTRRGIDVKLASLKMQDNTGEIRVTLWRDLVDKVEGLRTDAVLQIKNAYVRVGFHGEPELSSSSMTDLEVLERTKVMADSNVNDLQNLFIRKIDQVRAGESIEVQGTIVEITHNSRVYPACPTCGRRVEIEENLLICERCGIITDFIPRLIVDALIEDETGKINSVFSGNVAEELLDIKGEYAWNVSVKARNERAPIDIVRNRIIGIKVQITGKVSRSRNNGTLRLYVKELRRRVDLTLD